MNTIKPPASEHKKAVRQANPNAACQAHSNMAPTLRGRDKEAIVLAWIGIFGWTTTAIVKKLLNVQSGGYLPKLQRDGLVDSRSVGRMSEKVWSLTNPAGRQAAERILGWSANRIRPNRVNVSIATHDELGQRAALAFLKDAKDLVGEIRKLSAERQLRAKGGAVPDVVYADYTREGEVGWAAFEIETNAKGDAELEGKMRRLIELVVRQRRCAKMHVHWMIDGGEAVRSRYQRLWAKVSFEVRQQLYGEASPHQEEMARVKAMYFPTCSVHGLPP